MRAHCSINQDIFEHKHCLCFMHTPPFDVNRTHSFINEAPDLSHLSCCLLPLLLCSDTVAVSKFRGSILQGPILRHQQRQAPSESPAGSVSLLWDGTVYPSQHFLVASPDVPAPTHSSLFLQPRSAKVTRRVKFDCQICWASGIPDFLFNPPSCGGRGEAALVLVFGWEDRGEVNLLLNPQ